MNITCTFKGPIARTHLQQSPTPSYYSARTASFLTSLVADGMVTGGSQDQTGSLPAGDFNLRVRFVKGRKRLRPASAVGKRWRGVSRLRPNRPAPAKIDPPAIDHGSFDLATDVRLDALV